MVSANGPVAIWGDPRFSFKFLGLERVGRGVGLAVRPYVYAPLGAEDVYLGDDGVSAGGEVILDADFDMIRLGLNLGYTYRPDFATQRTVIGDQLVGSIAANVPFNNSVELVVDMVMSTLAKNFLGNGPGDAAEAALGLKFNTEKGASMTLGAGTGLAGGMGEVPVRLFTSIAFRSKNSRDRDGDGWPDHLDDCPSQREDMDNFKDHDGCPDFDHDDDGIRNEDDACPDLPEDRDGRTDVDGCPEFDNDGDTIPDAFDQCPSSPETVNGFEDEDGCPDTNETLIFGVVTGSDGRRLDGRVTLYPEGKVYDLQLGEYQITVKNPKVHELAFEAEGYLGQTREVTLSDGQQVQINMELKLKEEIFNEPENPNMADDVQEPEAGAAESDGEEE